MYLGWFDDTNKKSVMSKIDEAVERFTYRFGVAPAVCLVSETEVITHPVVEVRAARHVRPHHFFVGRDDLEAILQAEASGVRQSRPATTAVSISNKPAAKRAKAAAPELPAAVATPVLVAIEEPKPTRKSRRVPAIAELATIVVAPQEQAASVLEIAIAPEAVTPALEPLIAATDEPKPTRKTRRTAAAPEPVEAVVIASAVPEIEVAPAPELSAVAPLVLETQAPKPTRNSRRTAASEPIAAVAISAPEEPVIVVPEIAALVAAEVKQATRRRKTDTAAPVDAPQEMVSPVEVAAIVEVAPILEPEQPVAAAPAKATRNSRKRTTVEVVAPGVPVLVAEAVVVPEVPSIVAVAEAAAPVETTRRKKRAVEQANSEPDAVAPVAEPLPLPAPVEVAAAIAKPEPRRRAAKTPVMVEAQTIAPIITVDPEASKRNPRKKVAAAAVTAPTMPTTPARRGRKAAGSYVQAQMELPLAS